MSNDFETEEKVYILSQYEAEDGDWTVQILVQDGRLVVMEDKKDDGVETNYEYIFMNLVELLNDKISYKFMNDQGLISLGTFIRERQAKLN